AGGGVEGPAALLAELVLRRVGGVAGGAEFHGQATVRAARTAAVIWSRGASAPTPTSPQARRLLSGATTRSRGQWALTQASKSSSARPAGGSAPAPAASWRRCRAVRVCCHMSVFIAGARTTGRAGSQARHTHVRQLSASP